MVRKNRNNRNWKNRNNASRNNINRNNASNKSPLNGPRNANVIKKNQKGANRFRNSQQWRLERNNKNVNTANVSPMKNGNNSFKRAQNAYYNKNQGLLTKKNMNDGNLKLPVRARLGLTTKSNRQNNSNKLPDLEKTVNNLKRKLEEKRRLKAQLRNLEKSKLKNPTDLTVLVANELAGVGNLATNSNLINLGVRNNLTPSIQTEIALIQNRNRSALPQNPAVLQGTGLTFLPTQQPVSTLGGITTIVPGIPSTSLHPQNPMLRNTSFGTYSNTITAGTSFITPTNQMRKKLTLNERFSQL